MYSARAVTKALGGDWHGTYGMAPGPGHSPKDRSLKIIDGPGCEPIFHSFAGEPWWEVTDAIRSMGLLPERRAPRPPQHKERHRPPPRRCQPDNSERLKVAHRIWKRTEPIKGTLAERYLQNRGINIELPEVLRFAYLKHTNNGLTYPTLVAGVQDQVGLFSGIHRTYLMQDGMGKAGISSPKMALGPIAGGTVRLAPVSNTVALVEGIEDGLAVQQMTGQPAWACLGTSGFKNFEPPDRIKQVILAPDADNGGENVIEAAARRLANMGLDVRTAMPAPGKDWCDMLLDFEERAAIREFDGEEDRETAKDAAWAELLGELI